MQWSSSKLSRVERGLSPNVRVLDIEALCSIYGVDDELQDVMVTLAQQSAGKSWWQAFDDVMPNNFNIYVGLESSAKHLAIFRPDMLSGLFQIPEYARALDRVYFPDISEEELDRRVQLKTKRQASITRKTKPTSVDLIVQEAALRTVVGDSRVMAAQLNHLANMPSNVVVKVLPYTAGFPAGIAPGAIHDPGLRARCQGA